MGTGPRGALALAPCRVNGLFDHNVFYFLPWTATAPLLSRVNGPSVELKHLIVVPQDKDRSNENVPTEDFRSYTIIRSRR